MKQRKNYDPVALNLEFFSEKHSDFDVHEITQLWILRMLIPLKVTREFMHRGCFRYENVAVAIGLGKWVETDDGQEPEFDRIEILKEIRRLHKSMEAKAAKLTFPEIFVKNVEKVVRLVGLSPIEKRILEFVVMLTVEPMLRNMSDDLGDITTSKLHQTLSVILNIESKDIRHALHQNGTLLRSGLVVIDRSGTGFLQSKVSLLSENFADRIYCSDAEPIYLLRDIISQASAPMLSLNDYSHIQKEQDILLPYMRHVLDNKTKGVNILLYGPPGTGKTQFAKVIAKSNACDLFEVSSEDEDGDSLSGWQRLSALSAGQCFIQQRQSLMIFDEAEDAFPAPSFFYFGSRSSRAPSKAWMNKMLEENPVPTLWLTNDIDGIDPAYLRRFDMIISLPTPPQKQREIIIQKECHDLLTQSDIQRFAVNEAIAPAVIERSSRVIRTVKASLKEDQVSASLELLINATLKTQGHKCISSNMDKLPEIYDPMFINADKNLALIAEKLVDVKSARMCLFGPPGTGKTAYGKWLANQLEMPLIVKKVSDIASMFVGGTEKNIAEAFEQAKSQNAILLMDEVDSFLQDRRSAQRSWEITEVNEMLTQMESFNGIFIASTNLMDNLDQASLRRFDLKVKFDFLKADQSWLLFQRYCEQMQLPIQGDILQRKMQCLPNITPGDFAAIARQNRFNSIDTAFDLLKALEAECGLKENAVKQSIGFVTH